MKTYPFYKIFSYEFVAKQLFPEFKRRLQRRGYLALLLPLVLTVYAAFEFSPSVLTLIQLWGTLSTVLLIQYGVAYLFAMYIGYELRKGLA